MNIAFDSNHNGCAGILHSAEGREREMGPGFRAPITDFFGTEPGRSSMLNVTVQNLGDVSILHCQGRILFGDTALRNTALCQKSFTTLVLDFSQVAGIDAGGLGVLLDLRAWAQANGIQFKLMNVMRDAQGVLESTGLNRVFEVCSVHDMFHLLGGVPVPGPALRQTVEHPNATDQDLHGRDTLQKAGS